MACSALLAWMAIGADEAEGRSSASPASLEPKRARVMPAMATTDAAAAPSGWLDARADQDASAAEATREARAQQRRLWERRVDRARRTLDSYLEATRYPPSSRPIAEHPDQVRPAQPERDVPLDEEGEVHVLLRQDKVFLAGDDSVRFFVRCQSAQGASAPCTVIGATAREAEHRPGAGALPEVPLAFTDDGTGSGTYASTLTPSRDGFAMYEGTLRVHLEVQSGGHSRRALFDVLYTPMPPARFTGRVREVLREGSLELHVGLEVRKPGRYVITGRVDDAEGKPFALVTFNEELGTGAQEATLTVFGKLIVDGRPAQPLVLRDVEGFLLRESGDPDRELMRPLLGEVYRGQVHALARFSAKEWESEERARYLKELSRDVARAEEALGELGP